MIKQISGEGFTGVKLTPVFLSEEKTYKVDKRPGAASPILFYTATSTMRILKRNNGEIVMEHLNIKGFIDTYPYKGNFLGDLNFVNVGWDYGKEVEYLMIDPYTGESILTKRAK